MNREAMELMCVDELDEFGKVLGIAMSPAKTKEDKILLIERKRDRCASIHVLGHDFDIPIKRMHDKRITDLITKLDRSDDETELAMQMLLGDDQFDTLVGACTEPDGTIDIDAMGLAFVKIITSDELKNF